MNTEEKTVDQQDVLREVIEGLSKPQKEIPSKYFYDQKGSWLFDRICNLKEYYLTRSEVAILKQNVEEIAELLGPRVKLIEFGSGSSQKTRLLLDHMQNLAAYIPIDISRDHLFKATTQLENEYPDLKIEPVCTDYTQPFELPESGWEFNRKIIYYPGSTIGNFNPQKARQFLKLMASMVKPEGGVLIGVDLKKDREILEAAYNDDQGVTAAFNKNILEHLNRLIDSDFELDTFEHRAFYNKEEGRVEMHLVSTKEQVVHVDDVEFVFKKGETIHTENSYKYSLDEFEELVSNDFLVQKVWTDDDENFSVQYLTVL